MTMRMRLTMLLLIVTLGIIVVGGWAMQTRNNSDETLEDCTILPVEEGRNLILGQARIHMPDDPTQLLRPTEAAPLVSSCWLDE